MEGFIQPATGNSLLLTISPKPPAKWIRSLIRGKLPLLPQLQRLFCKGNFRYSFKGCIRS